MRRLPAAAPLLGALTLFLPALASAAPATPTAPPVAATPAPTFAFEQFALPNGMRVVLHVDKALPNVFVDIAYQVGSRHEVKGRTGFAHLFEHLMFMGTKRVPNGEFDAKMELVGGYNNAWTSNDFTNYWETGPTGSLDLLLYLEADRMRDLGTSMTQEKLDIQRDIVKNERRQSYENRPYGKASLLQEERLFPVAHPYHHPVIGSHADLEAASVRDVQEFFATWYDPANAVLSVSGDFDTKAARATIEKYFSTIPSRGKPKSPDLPPPVVLEKNVREVVVDDVELTQVTYAYHAPVRGSDGDAVCDLLATALGEGKGSRLEERLVVKDKLAQSVAVEEDSRVAGSVFAITVQLKSGASLEKVEKILDEEIAKLVKSGLTDAELARAKALVETRFIGDLEALRQRGTAFSLWTQLYGSPDHAAAELGRHQKVDGASALGVAKQVFGGKRVEMIVTPKVAPPAAPAVVKPVKKGGK
jgi:predicted Zn-dependent peptidase